MYTSRLVVDTKVKPVSGPHSAKSRSNKENLVLGTTVSSTGKQRSRSISDASASSSISAPTHASTSSLVPPKPFHGMASQTHSRPSSPSHEETVRIGPEYVLAMHDYEPQSSNTTCLSFRTGQVIHVLNRDPSGWWDGELEGRRGWFPSNYVNADFGKSKAQAVQVRVESDTNRSFGLISSDRLAATAGSASAYIVNDVYIIMGHRIVTKTA